MFDLPPVDFNCPYIWRILLVDSDFLFGATEELGTLLDDFIDVGRFDLEFAPAGESKQLPCQVRTAPDYFFDCLEVLFTGIKCIHIHQHQRGAPLDSHQQIVEIMGDAAGQRTDRFKLLRLPQFCF